MMIFQMFPAVLALVALYALFDKLGWKKRRPWMVRHHGKRSD
ncbi:maltose ABC transporter permease [Vibrio cholerae]|nr:maltose ABC transporter permease [Vibrio cholerae]